MVIEFGKILLSLNGERGMPMFLSIVMTLSKVCLSLSEWYILWVDNNCLLFCWNIFILFFSRLTVLFSYAGSLKYWYERNKVNHLIANSAVWDDGAVSLALDSAALWVKGLPFVQSLSGDWKFFLATTPTSAPRNFYEVPFEDSSWESLPGECGCKF